MRFIFFIFLCVCALNSTAQLVKNNQEVKKALSTAKPGDIITLQDGVWTDVNLVFKAKGTADKPIKITSQTPGGVIITGKSNLKISGEYLEISNLHFSNGYSAEGDLIVFKTGTDELANHCRISGFVIENFSQPDRFKNDNWIVLWGKNNRVDHCTLVDKINAGPTLIVELNDERSQENNHSIDHNYFKGRQRLGSNGGETMRIGVSRYSLTASKTLITHNYFEHCNGEVEILSIKSGQNKIINNTFFECEGSLVLRHGSKNVVENNIFLGNNKPFTGGVRIINPGHTVFNNVFKDLKGNAFRSALAVMNGVPNSAINRYYQVKDATIYRNTFINCDHLEFGVGKDSERTLAPENLQFTNNLVVSENKNVYTDYNKTPGLMLTDNEVSTTQKIIIPVGFKSVKIKNTLVDGISLPQASSTAGADLTKIEISNDKNTGASWYKPGKVDNQEKGKRIILNLIDAKHVNDMLAQANNGDTLVFNESGNYKLTNEILVNKHLVFLAAPGLKEKPVLINVSTEQLPAFITIENGGSLKVKGLAFCGTFESYGDVQAGIRSTSQLMNKHYSLWVDYCRFYQFNESTFSAIKASKSTFADSLVVKNSVFYNISGTAIDFSSEKDDKGIYNAENTIIENCVFDKILGSALNLYRGGNDESTLGPFLTINQCTFNNVDNREKGATLRLIGVQHGQILNSIFNNSGHGGSSIKFEEYITDDLIVNYCNFYQSGKINSAYNKVIGKFIYYLPPSFLKPELGNFKLKTESLLNKLSSKKGALGAQIK